MNEQKGMVIFCHGALRDPYEKQANVQGYTLGEEKERLEKLGFSIVYCWIHGILMDSQYSMALGKLQKQLIKALKPLPAESQTSDAYPADQMEHRYSGLISED